MGMVLGLWACERENDASIAQEIQGEWEWVETTYQYRNTAEGTGLTPASTDTLMFVRIHADEIEILKNDVSFGTFDYSLADSDKTVYLSIDYTGKAGTLKLEQGPIRIDNEQLHIAGGYNDEGGAQVLKRVK